MTKAKLAAAVMAAVAGLMGQGTMPDSARAAELKVIGSSGVRAVINELGPQFERESGHKLTTDFEVIAVLKRRIEAGETFDVAILGPAAIDDLVRQGKIAAGTSTPFGRTGLGIAVRQGAARPDVGSADAVKQALLAAKSVAHAKEGESGIAFRAVLDQLGIASQMQPKLKAYDATGLRQSVASGEVEMAVTGIGPMLTMPGTEFLGGLPPELQKYVVFHAAIGAATKEPDVARALLRFLTAPAVAPVKKAKGLES